MPRITHFFLQGWYSGGTSPVSRTKRTKSCNMEIHLAGSSSPPWLRSRNQLARTWQYWNPKRLATLARSSLGTTGHLRAGRPVVSTVGCCLGTAALVVMACKAIDLCRSNTTRARSVSSDQPVRTSSQTCQKEVKRFCSSH